MLNNIPVIVLPNLFLPYVSDFITVSTEFSKSAIEYSLENNKKIILACNKTNASYANIIKNKVNLKNNIYNNTVLAKIVGCEFLDEGIVRINVTEFVRVKLINIVAINNGIFCGLIEQQKDAGFTLSENENYDKILVNKLVQLSNHLKLDKFIIKKINNTTKVEHKIYRLADLLNLSNSEKYAILTANSLAQKLEQLLVKIDEQINLSKIETEIFTKTKKKLEKNQREYFLNEQLKIVKDELNKSNGIFSDAHELITKIKQLKLKKDITNKLLKETNRLKNMPVMSAEAGVIKNYIEQVISMPWHNKNKENFNLTNASKILEKTHYGLTAVKDSIVEYLAVIKKTKKLYGKTICLVGPPGVGKTSIVESIAVAMGRSYERIALGGMKDEAEIRGHRKTYIGAMPGRIVQKLIKAKTKNPVILLDEIDKLSNDYRGDPSSALLEVLDPEQNKNFTDNYLEIEFDLSEVLFICTANNSSNIPEPLRDRIEIIKLNGYLEYEKLAITKKYLIPKQIKLNGLNDIKVGFSDNAIRKIINSYSKESGVRELERQIGKVCRKTLIKSMQNNKIKEFKISTVNLKKLLGVELFIKEKSSNQSTVGEIKGLSWSQLGGNILYLQCTMFQDKKKDLILTGSLGNIMKESANLSLSVAKRIARDKDLKIPDNSCFHIHVPDGATPKDGPSAGIGLSCVLISSLFHYKINAGIAITGEISLTGKILPIGGLREKLYAAYSDSSVKTVIIPYDNKKDLVEVASFADKLDIKLVSNIEEVLPLVMPEFAAIN